MNMFDFLSPYQLNFLKTILLPAFISTFEMLFFTTIFSVILGFLVAVVLAVTEKGGLFEKRIIFEVLNFIVNAVLSFPIIILIVFMLPATKSIVGTSIGVKAAIVPLTVSSTAFMAKLMFSSLQEVDRDLVEAMRSFGLKARHVILRVMFPEALPSITSGIILGTISVLASTAVAGAVGAGGIGSVALTYGYQSFNKTVMYIAVGILIVMVQIIQWIGFFVYRKMKV
jgi:D-methionine transport system permease protein